jgi:hypothetical protein
VDLYKHYFPNDFLATSLAEITDVAFGDRGTSFLSEVQILSASREVYATYVTTKELYSRW